MPKKDENGHKFKPDSPVRKTYIRVVVAEPADKDGAIGQTVLYFAGIRPDGSASVVTLPWSGVDFIRNSDINESRAVRAMTDSGYTGANGWDLKIATYGIEWREMCR